ncbi:MAG: pyruvoyl-dependent arginine decarboxylase [Candidatus Nanohalarchaeota archaeon]|nr:MAG: pyruvoyl-dependent arginine decarboxylase [Candidatus Nanohaloarchaeota archaeon]
MEIKITCGTGEGQTKISAFDKALYDAGIANYNLIALSSVIPENAKIIESKIDWNEKEHGNRLYVVLAKCIEVQKEKEAWAGLGWIQDELGKGLFVEHSGSSEKEIVELINASLKDMQRTRREKYGKKINHSIACIKCNGNPVCALVCAVYKSTPW